MRVSRRGRRARPATIGVVRSNPTQSLARPDQQVPVVRHQAVRQQPDRSRDGQRVGQAPLECGVVAVVVEQPLPADAPVQHVEDRPGRCDPRSAWHDRQHIDRTDRGEGKTEKRTCTALSRPSVWATKENGTTDAHGCTPINTGRLLIGVHPCASVVPRLRSPESERRDRAYLYHFWSPTFGPGKAYLSHFWSGPVPLLVPAFWSGPAFGAQPWMSLVGRRAPVPPLVPRAILEWLDTCAAFGRVGRVDNRPVSSHFVPRSVRLGAQRRQNRVQPSSRRSGWTARSTRRRNSSRCRSGSRGSSCRPRSTHFRAGPNWRRVW